MEQGTDKTSPFASIHESQEPQSWIDFLNDIEGLISEDLNISSVDRFQAIKQKVVQRKEQLLRKDRPLNSSPSQFRNSQSLTSLNSIKIPRPQDDEESTLASSFDTGKPLSSFSRRGTDSSIEEASIDGAAASIHTSNIDMDILGRSDRTDSAGATSLDAAGTRGFIEALRLAALNINPNDIGNPLAQSGPSSSNLSNSSTTLSGSTSNYNNFSSSGNKQNTNNTGSAAGSVNTEFSHDAPIKMPESREKYYQRSFPVHRKLFVHSTKLRNILQLTKKGQKQKYFLTAISPSAAYMATCTSSHYCIYRIPDDYNEAPDLTCSGDIENIDDIYCITMNDHWLVIAGRAGQLIVFSLSTGEKVWQRDLYTYIDSVDISPHSSYIVCALLGHDQATKSAQPMICIIRPEQFPEPGSPESFANPNIVTFSSPYKDTIRTISISSQETCLVCATDKEARFFVVSLVDPQEPRVLLRSSRKRAPLLDTDDDFGSNVKKKGANAPYQGITSVQFLPNNRYLVVTSNTPGSTPVVLDTKLTSRRVKVGQRYGYGLGATGIAPSVSMRLDKLGSSIHGAAVSPRGDAIAFVDTQGLIYILKLPHISTDTKRIVVCFEVCPADSQRTAASIRFTPDGGALLVLDRKGVLQIADFAAGLPQHAGITKSRILS